jgi:5,6,7,8-tetrahydromethanopterin hydro-lyase
MSLFVGESLVGDGNEVAHIDLMIGDKTGPVGIAFANALSSQTAGHSNLLAVLAPNVAVKPSTVMITKVTIKGAKQAVQMFGPAQKAVADAVSDAVKEGTIPADQAEDLVIVCGVFIHWEADDDKKIYEYNYAATKESIERAMGNQPSASEMLAKRDSAAHPFYAG